MRARGNAGAASLVPWAASVFLVFALLPGVLLAGPAVSSLTTDPVHASSGWVSSPVTVTASAAGASHIRCVMEGPTTEEVIVDGPKGSFRVAQDGEWSITHRAFDGAAAIEPTQGPVVVRVDQRAPHTKLLSRVAGVPVEFGAWVAVNVVVRAETSDELQGTQVSGVEATYVRLNGGASRVLAPGGLLITDEGSNRLDYWSVDRAGNVEPVRTETVRIDRTPPVTSSDARTEQAYVGTATVNLRATDALSGVAATQYSIDGGPVQTGTTAVIPPGQSPVRRIMFWSVDKAGNREPETVLSLVVLAADVPAPETTSVAMSGPVAVDLSTWQRGGISMALVATDPAGAGIRATYYRIGSTTTTYAAPFTVSETGTTTVQFWSVSRAAVTEPPKTVLVRIDGDPPKTRADVAEGAMHFGVMRVRLSSLDDASGVSETFYALDDGPLQAGQEMTVSPSETRARTLRFWSVDRAGNREQTRTVAFSLLPTDTVPPKTFIKATSLGSDASLARWHSAPVSLSFEASDGTHETVGSGVAATFYRLAGVTSTFTAPFELEIEGANDLWYWSVDKGGSIEETNLAQVRIDKTPPSSEATWSPRSLSEMTISIKATDALSGVSAIEWRLNGVRQPRVTISARPGSSTVRLPVSSAGTHTVTYVVIDEAGNRDQERRAGPFHVRGLTSISLSSTSRVRRNVVIPINATVQGRLLAGRPPGSGDEDEESSGDETGEAREQIDGLPGRTVVLEYSPDPRFKKSVRTALTTTGARGAFTFKTTLSARTHYRVRFAGEPDYLGSRSEVIWYKPRPALTLRISRSARPRTIYVTGSIRPAHPQGKHVRVEWARTQSGKSAGSTWAAITPKAGRSSYKARLTLPRGTWYVRAVSPDDGFHARATTPEARVRID